MKANTVAKVLVLSTLAISSFGCKEMKRENAIINRYHVQIDSLYDAKGRARAMHDSTFDADAAKLEKGIRADSALLASGKATEQEKSYVSFKKNLVYPVAVYNLKVMMYENNEEQKAFQQKIDSVQTIRDATAKSAYAGMNSIDNVVLACAMAIVVGIAAIGVVIAQYGERIKAGFNRMFGTGKSAQD